MSAEHHYVYGSGMFGCLYDYGPNFCEDKQDAIESLVWLFDEQLEDGEAERMRANLAEDGIHRFENPHSAGAQYADVSKANGPCPESEES